MGHEWGWLSIIDIQRQRFLFLKKVLSSDITSLAIRKDNKSIYICDMFGNTGIVKWISNPKTENDFKSKNSYKIQGNDISGICLSSDNQKLIAADHFGVKLIDLKKRQVIYSSSLDEVHVFKSFNNGEKTIVLDKEKSITIFDNKKLKISDFITFRNENEEITSFAVV